MNQNNLKYVDYFDVDDKYFPCIDDSAIEAGARWDDTYPHDAFIDLLKKVERMLSGTTKRSIWIHGAYGTGKSKCAYALKRILEVPEDELEEYWNSADNLKQNPDLLQRLRGHREKGILTVYRYASGNINTPRELFLAIQESVKKALKENKIKYQGENTLKESVIAWLGDQSHKTFFDSLLKKPEWKSTFNQDTTEEVVSSLKRSSDVRDLMNNIFSLAEKEGITAMSLDADKLKAWLKDIIKTNNLKIVMIWDEFSGFFKQNRNSLDEFQKIVALCQDSEAPFYLIIVTHQTESIIDSSDQSWKVVQQRFDFVPITLPDNIAFELIGNAFKPKEAAKAEWEQRIEPDLNNRLADSRSAVMNTARIRKPNVIKDIMPIHPMAALVLKNIAVAFQANQRSMFDFIKTSNTDDIHAFQWFIENTGPYDDDPLLMIDQLWNFFYEKGRENLSSDIRLILDTFPQQQNLREDEKRVLKTILIMQAIDKRLGGGIPLLKPTDQNLSYAFEGDRLHTAAKILANKLKNQGILIQNPIGNGKFAYGAAVLAGDQTKIDKLKEDVKKTSTTAKLVADGKLDTVLSLSAALSLRYEKTPGTGSLYSATIQDFNKICLELKNKESPWKFTAVLAFAKEDDDITRFRKTIKEFAGKDEYKHIVFIDALSTPLSTEDYNQYVEFAAMASYYAGNNNQSAKENENKAKQVLATTWKNKINSGKFTIYYSGALDGVQVMGAQNVAPVLESIVRKKHPYLFDFNRGVNENQLKLTNPKASAEAALIGKTSGVIVNAEKYVLPKVWTVEKYWENPDTSSENISVIKRDLDGLIDEKFKVEGSISIDTIYDHLESAYGFSPCNITAFIIGFLLREFKEDPYRYSDENGASELMTPGKLAEMISNYMKAKTGGKAAKTTNIVMLTPEEKTFNEVTEKAWSLTPGSCSSVALSEKAIREKMKSLGLPVWSLEEVDGTGVYDIIQKYIDFVQKGGDDAHKIALQIGKIAMNRPSLGDTLAELLTKENCRAGMKLFLKRFENGELLLLAEKNGRKEEYLTDISNLFSVEYSNLWNKETGLEQIRNLITEYRFVEATNEILGVHVGTRNDAAEKWHDRLNFSKCTCESLIEHNPALKETYTFLLKVYHKEKILPDQMKTYTDGLISDADEVKHHFENELSAFSKIYSPYLTDLSEDDIEKLLQTPLGQIFSLDKTKGNSTVKKAADEYRKNLTKTQLFDLWKEKTKSKSPMDWSEKHRTPIMKIVSVSEYDDAKKTFETLNSTNATEVEINHALEYLSHADKLCEDLNNNKVVEHAFRSLLDIYAKVLPDSDKVRDELEKANISAYFWDTNPQIAKRIRDLADAEYNAGGSDKVVAVIKKMDNDKLKEYLIRQIKENIKLGLEIINTDDGE